MCRDPVEFLKVSSAITGSAFHRCLFSKLGSYNALYYGGLKSNICIPNRFSSATADYISRYPKCRVRYLANFTSDADFFALLIAFKNSSDRVAQMSSTESKDIKCHASVSFVLIREPHVVFLGKNWHFSVNSAMFGTKRNL